MVTLVLGDSTLESLTPSVCEETLKLFCAMHGFVQNHAVYVQMFWAESKQNSHWNQTQDLVITTSLLS